MPNHNSIHSPNGDENEKDSHCLELNTLRNKHETDFADKCLMLGRTRTGRWPRSLESVSLAGSSGPGEAKQEGRPLKAWNAGSALPE